MLLFELLFILAAHAGDLSPSAAFAVPELALEALAVAELLLDPVLLLDAVGAEGSASVARPVVRKGVVDYREGLVGEV